jgi:hypothetical protein
VAICWLVAQETQALLFLVLAISNAITNRPSALRAGATSASTPLIYLVNSNGVVGTISTSGSGTTVPTSSDYRLKDNVAPMTGALI